MALPPPKMQRLSSEDVRQMEAIDEIAGLDEDLDPIEDGREQSFTASDAKNMSTFPIPISTDVDRSNYSRSISEEDSSNMAALEKQVGAYTVPDGEDMSDKNFTADDYKNMGEFN